MRAYILRISIFSFGLIILFLPSALFISGFDNLDKDTSENHNIISLQSKSSYDSLDILFIGNSYCYSAIDTYILDSQSISSFNLGIATKLLPNLRPLWYKNKFSSLMIFSCKYFFNQNAGSVKIPERTCLDLD